MLADYRLNELREVYLEIFCTTKTSVDNPLLAPSGHGGRKTFLVIDEGYLDSHEGYWVEEEEDGTEGFLEADEDTFRVYDDENYTWFQRRFQGRKMKRGFKGGRRKGKGKGGKGSSGRRFFKKRKGRSNLRMIRQMLGKPKDNGMTVKSEEAYAAKGKERKERRAKEKASSARMERTGSPVPKVEQPSLQMLPRAVLQLPQRSTLTT